MLNNIIILYCIYYDLYLLRSVFEVFLKRDKGLAPVPMTDEGLYNIYENK